MPTINKQFRGLSIFRNRGFSDKSLVVSPVSIAEIQNDFGWYMRSATGFTDNLDPFNHAVARGKYYMRPAGVPYGEWCDFDTTVPTHWTAASLAERVARASILIDYEMEALPAAQLYIRCYNPMDALGGLITSFEFRLDATTLLLDEIAIGSPAMLGYGSIGEICYNKLLISIARVDNDNKQVRVTAWDRGAAAITTNVVVFNGVGLGNIPIMFSVQPVDALVAINDIQISSKELAFGAAPFWANFPLP